MKEQTSDSDDFGTTGATPSPSSASSYFGEIGSGWRALLAAAIGMGFGGNLDRILMSLFAPHLMATFGWSKSQFALIGSTLVMSIICVPIAGRLADIFGVRKMAAVGVFVAPLIDLGLSAMTGDFRVFFLLICLQVPLVGLTTTTVVYGRLIAEHFVKARGIALSISASSTPLLAALLTPPLAFAIEAYGWRHAYWIVGGITLTAGLITLALIPPRTRPAAAIRACGTHFGDFGRIVRSPAFWVIGGGMLLSNLTLIVQSSQLKLIVMDVGVAPQAAVWMISLYSIGIVAGRLLCGLALDRFPPPLVATIGIGLPAIGLLTLASGVGGSWVVAASVMVIGLSTGAETDIAAYLIMRYFATRDYGAAYGLMASLSAISAVLGSLLLSYMLRFDDHYAPFLLVSGIVTLGGSLLFLLLGRIARHEEPVTFSKG